jgi:hypothetical protein
MAIANKLYSIKVKMLRSVKVAVSPVSTLKELVTKRSFIKAYKQ